MIALLNDTPLYCPSCGRPTHLEQGGNYQLTFLKTHKPLNCATYWAICQLADRTGLLRKAAASRGDMVEYVMGDDG